MDNKTVVSISTILNFKMVFSQLQPELPEKISQALTGHPAKPKTIQEKIDDLTEAYEEKFEKLKMFYTEGLNKTDGWNKYSTINIKYKNQVVCTKK